MANYDFTGDRLEKLKVYTRSGGENTTPRGPEDILNHENKNVLIVGRPGIGKTLCCTKLLRDWAFNKVFHESPDSKIHFDATFFIKFRAFNAKADLSLRELLTLSEHSPSDHMDDEVWKYVLDNPQRVLIMFDGIDEFKHNSKIGDENFEPKFRKPRRREDAPTRLVRETCDWETSQRSCRFNNHKTHGFVMHRTCFFRQSIRDPRLLVRTSQRIRNQIQC